MEETPGRNEEGEEVSGKKRESERSQQGGSEGRQDVSPNKRRKTSFGAVDIPLTSPLLGNVPLLHVAPPTSPPFIPYDPARRIPSTSIAALINHPPAPTCELSALPSKGAPTPPPSKSQPSIISSSQRSSGFKFPPPPQTASRSSVSDQPALVQPPQHPTSFPFPDTDVPHRPESHAGTSSWLGVQATSSAARRSISPVASSSSRLAPPGLASSRASPPLSERIPAKGSSTKSTSRVSELHPPQAAPVSPPLRERARALPRRRSMSSEQSLSGRRGSTSRGPSKAWFSLGPMEAVDMRHWTQDQRDSYQRGYTDALQAVQRGTVGVGGDQYPQPKLLRGDDILPTEEEYAEASSRRPSITDLSRSYYPEASARRPLSQPSRRNPHDRQVPFVPYPPSQFPEPPTHPHHQSTSAWADDRRAEYARFEYTVPASLHSDSAISAHGSATQGGPYYPAPHPRSYSYVDHPTYTSNPTTGTGTTTTSSPSQITRVGQRQLISCYPCRLRKMKCDGTKPCYQCVRRGGEAECDFAMTVRRRGKGKKPGEPSTDGEGEGGEGGDGNESGQESGDERWRMKAMNLPDVGEE